MAFKDLFKFKKVKQRSFLLEVKVELEKPPSQQLQPYGSPDKVKKHSSYPPTLLIHFPTLMKETLDTIPHL